MTSKSSPYQLTSTQDVMQVMKPSGCALEGPTSFCTATSFEKRRPESWANMDLRSILRRPRRRRLIIGEAFRVAR